MNDIAIKIEDVSKLYKLGLVGVNTLGDDLNRWWHLIRGKSNPNFENVKTNDRNSTEKTDYVWGLKDVSLTVKKGEVVGIIGKNGAGKSTLLKILSRVTNPTKGSIKVRGKISSLLEVGTGFHPDLTGRENIFLNAAILGMSRSEVLSKLDEIVDFAGVGIYLDTPVKRYSSGMYVRLAFAVAAHLEPDILIVDEVLAVGDAEFQQKAIGRMQAATQQEGRTVLVVSHNMASIRKLCKRGIVLHQGSVLYDGETEGAVARYLGQEGKATRLKLEADELKNALEEQRFVDKEIISVQSLSISDSAGLLKGSFKSDEDIVINVGFSVIEEIADFRLLIVVNDRIGNEILATCSTDDPEMQTYKRLKPGKYNWKCVLKKNTFGGNQFFASVYLSDPSIHHVRFQNVFAFEVNFLGYNGITKYVNGSTPIRPQFQWSLER
ncbi:ATP-binding cassette domain-containing protein [Leptospira gomenensis]|uniref:ATP-binding cassette domain-containing protein n=1 Tax=Leptospira gomenensis TaxID=2484974 RepID=A0A5F1Y7K2_9LEPT|nr:polysaccharide ABC transporter ATP-binding protein [Leptospira gomenensis]TGK30935.1 ATP-binding cassette domain-containing protein [Leptospira gomenensis]TGK38177.1 ATP-binding cassette domain-containing protein [Leptospira gomenensis]TGK45345.1 ATP-binding cassette domain-containing protein [Leptospira gomenensis]TGK66258.1 ATP-binding cassette domain-containing protein [Leptospira gomenensis]